MSKMDITANTRSLSCENNLNTLTPRIISCNTTSLVPLGKYLFGKKMSLAVSGNKFLRKQITIHSKSLVCKDRVCDK